MATNRIGSGAIAGGGVRMGRASEPGAILFAQNQPAFYGSGGLTSAAAVQKIRADSWTEFAAYTPVSADGIDWARWLFSNRFYGAAYAPDVICITAAKLWASSTLALFAATGTSGITADTATATVAAASATSRTGTWTGPVTVNSIANSYWTATTGDKVAYTLTVPAGGIIYHEGPASASNGGIGEVIIKLSGTEITSGEYLCPLSSGVRIADYTAPNNVLGVIPLAKVTAGGSYTIEITRSAQSAASGRLYDTRVRAFNAVAYNLPGWYGANIQNSGIASTLANLSYHAGVTAVYQLTNCTRIGFRYGTNANAGQAAFKVYNSGGVEIGAYVNTSVDMYAAASALAEIIVAEGLAKGTYYLVATVAATKNASSTGYRFYSFGPRAYDETTAGVVGTDAFYGYDVPTNPTTSADVGTYCISGPGNFDYASQWRSSGSSSGVENFVGAVHGSETTISNASITLAVDGTAQDYNAAAANAFWIGASINVAFSTNPQTPDNATAFGTLARSWTFSREGWRSVTTLDINTAAYRHTDYIAMLQSPNGGDTRTSGLASAQNWVWTDDPAFAEQFDTSAGALTNYATAVRGMVHAGPDWAIYCVLNSATNPSASMRVNDSVADQVKSYIIGQGDVANGDLIAPGSRFVVDKTWRVLKGAFV